MHGSLDLESLGSSLAPPRVHPRGTPNRKQRGPRSSILNVCDVFVGVLLARRENGLCYFPMMNFDHTSANRSTQHPQTLPKYTGSIFLALMSTFESDFEDNCNLDNTLFGLCGYGSGAKAKVFEGKVNHRWREVVAGWHLFERLAGRMAIDHVTYENLHKGIQDESVVTPRSEFALVEIGDEGVDEGARRYRWVGA